jgi:hypothetical protein
MRQHFFHRDDDSGHGRRFMRGFGGWHFGRHAHRHEGGSGRLFDYGELRFVLLRMIAQTPRHGYELIKAIEERMGGTYSPSPGVIYPTLTLLEEQGYATVTADSGKKQVHGDGRGPRLP